MVQFIDLLVESKAIARRLGSSITDALCAIETGSIEARRRFFGGWLTDSSDSDSQSYGRGQQAPTKESLPAKGHGCFLLMQRPPDSSGGRESEALYSR